MNGVPEAHLHRILDLAQRVAPLIRRFYLAGGTALMLRHRHRVSTDLDFFRETPFSFQYWARKLRKHLPVSKEVYSPDAVDLWIQQVKVSLVFFPFKNIEPLEDFGGIPMASDYDIFLNKIYAAGRRVEPKDPIDFVFLVETYHLPWEKVKQDFETKFPDQNFEIHLGAILNTQDYPDLSPAVQRKLQSIAEEVLEWKRSR